MTEKPKKAKIDALKKKIEKQLEDAFGEALTTGEVNLPNAKVSLSGISQDEIDTVYGKVNLGGKDKPEGIKVNLAGKTFEEMQATLKDKLGEAFNPANIVTHHITAPDPADISKQVEKIQKALKNAEALKESTTPQVLKSGEVTLSADGFTIGKMTFKADGSAKITGSGGFKGTDISVDPDQIKYYDKDGNEVFGSDDWKTAKYDDEMTLTPPQIKGWGKDTTSQEILNDLKAFKDKYKNVAPPQATDDALQSLKAKLHGAYGIQSGTFTSGSGTFEVKTGNFTTLDQHGNPKSEPVPLSALFAPKGGGSFESDSNKIANDAHMSKPSAESMLVSLAGEPGVAKYVHASINADWDPKDHPRDPNTGEFVKGPVGYIFGKAKKATFKGIKTANGLKDLEFDLKPGDVAFQTPGKNIVVSHANGDYTLHKATSGETSVIPAGSKDTLAEWAQNGQLKKVAENPGTTVKASTKEAAAKMIEDPQKFTAEGKMKGAPVPPAKKPVAPSAGLTPSPLFKPGKTKYTAKQVTEYQAENAGKKIGADKDGVPITSGSWVDVNGTPYQVFASPYADKNITAYKWVKTKQQAANEAKEDPFDFASAEVIPDPTGKPYLGVDVVAAKPKAKEVTLGTGSLMSQADTVVEIPNASVAHAKHLAEAQDKPLDAFGDVHEDDSTTKPLTDAGGVELFSGEWVEIGGKPYQVHSSPNKGNIALKKWVGTKKQAATTSYDFPAGVLAANNAVAIGDPTGHAYTPLTDAQKAEALGTPEPEEVDPELDGLPAGSVKDEISQFPEPDEAEETPEVTETPEPAPAPEPAAKSGPVLKPTSVGSFVLNGKTFHKMSDGSWEDFMGFPMAGWEIPQNIEKEWDYFSTISAQISTMQTGDVLHATHIGGQKSTYTLESDGLMHASPTGGTASPEKLLTVVSNQWGEYTFTVEKKHVFPAEPKSAEPEPQVASQATTAIDHVNSAAPGDSLEWGYTSFDPDLYTKQDDGTWSIFDQGQADDLDYEPSMITQDEFISQLETSGNDAAYLTFTKKAASIEEDDTETAVAAPAPQNVLSLIGDMSVTLDPGDQVYKNTDNGTLYAVKKASGGTTVYSNTGLVFPTGMDLDDYEDWAQVDTWPGKVDGKQSIYTPDPWAAASGAPDKVTEDVSDMLGAFNPLKAQPGDQLILSGGEGADEVYTYNGPVTLKGKASGTWTMSAADQSEDIVWTSGELDMTLAGLDPSVTISYASATPLTSPDHPFSSAEGQEVAQAPQMQVLKDVADAETALGDAAPGSELSVHYADGHVEPLVKEENGQWNALEDVGVTNGYSSLYLASIINNDTYLSLISTPKPVTLEATPVPEPSVSDEPTPAGTDIKDLLTKDGKPTPALLDAEIAIGADNIDEVPIGTKIAYQSGSVYTKQTNGTWKDAASSIQYPSTAILGTAHLFKSPNYDFSGVTFTSEPKPEPSVVQANAAVIDTAMPGDKVQITVGGVVMTYTKTEDGWLGNSGQMVPSAQTIKALATTHNNGTFIYAGNDHTATKAPSSDSENPKLPEGITEGVGATKPGKVPQKQTGTSKSTAAQTNEVTLPDGTNYTLKPGEAFGFIENFVGGGGGKPDIFVLVTSAGGNKVWNADGLSLTLSQWWAPDKALSKLTPTSLKTAINKFGGELHGSNTYKKAKTDAASYGTFGGADDIHINSHLSATEPNSGNLWAWASHNNPFSSVRTSLINLIHGGVASPQQGWAKPGQDGYKGIVPLAYFGTDSNTPFYPDPNTGDLLSWNDLDVMTRAAQVAKIAPVAAGIHNLINDFYTPEKIKSWEGKIPEDQIKKFKARITANKNAMLGLTRLGELAEALTDPDSTKTGGWTIDALEAELGIVQKWVNGPKHGMKDFEANKIPVEEFTNILTAAFKKRKFTEGLSGIGFDPLNATTEEYDAYAKSKGFEHLSLLSAVDQKNWVLGDLGDPSITAYTKTQIANNLVKAKQKAALAALSASLKADQVKETINPHADVPSAPEEGTGVYGITEMKQGLKKSYTWKFNGAWAGLTHLGDDDWLMEVEGSEPIHVTDAMAAAAVKAINTSLAKGEDTYTDFKPSKFPAYAGVSIEQSMKAKFAEHGLDIGDLMDVDSTFNWSTYANAHSDEIIAAAEAEGFGYMELVEQIPVAGMTYLAIKGSGDKVWDYLFATQWDKEHAPVNHPGDPATPEGKAALTALANKVASLPGGAVYLSDNANSAQSAKVATALGIPPMLVSQWTHSFPGHLLAEYKTPDLQQVTGDDLAPGETHANQPAGVSDEVWGVVVNMTKDTDVSDLVGPTITGYTEAMLESLLADHTSAPFAGVPKSFKQLALWSYVGTGGLTNAIPEQSEFSTAVIARVQAGDFLSGSTSVWTHPETGAKFPVSPGAKVLKIDGGYNATGYMVTGPPDKSGKPTSGFFFPEDNPNQVAKKTGTQFHAYYIHPNAQVLFSVPDPVTFEKAKAAKGPGLGSELTEPIWFKTEQIEQGKASSPMFGSDSVVTAALKNSDYLKANYPALYGQKITLPEQVKSAIAWLLAGHSVEGVGGISSAGLAKNTKHPLLDLLEYKAGQGHYASMGSAGLFDSGQPWNAYLSKGLTTPADVGKWSETATAAYVEHFGLKGVSQISPHLTAILHPEAPTVEAGVSWKKLPDFNSLVLTNTGKNPGGMHTKSVWVDTNGDEWMSKAFNSDPNAKARVDAETNANKIGALFGFGNPVAETVALTNTGKISGAGTGQGSGNYTYFQHMKPANGSFSGKSPSDLTTKQLQQAMSHHVLDWIVSNHDTHSENLLLGKDGNVFGIDLGQAFKFFPDDQLAVGYLPPGNGAPVWYDQFYKAVQNGSIDKATADDVVKHVLLTAQRVAKTNDAEYKALLTDALKNRENFPAKYPTAEKFIDALMERKHSTFDDFVSLYQGIYAGSPYEWDIDTENLTPPKIGDTHVSVTSDLTKSVMKSKAAGQALMVNSLDLEDSYLMLQPQKDKNGSHLLLGEAKVRQDGDKKLVAWLKQQTVVDNTGVFYNDFEDDYDNSVTYTGPSSSEAVYATLPANNELFSAMVNYSKTVSSHNKSGDQNYNANTVSIATSAKVGIDAMLKNLETWEKQNPNIPYAGKPTGYFTDYQVHMYTMEQHQAFKTMLETYQGYFDTVKAKEGSDQKVTPHFTQITYSPSADVSKAYFAAKGLPEVPMHADPGTSITWKEGSTTYIATKDGKGSKTWTLSSQVGKAEPTTQTITSGIVYDVMATEPSAKATDESAIKPVEEEVKESATVQVGTKLLKVSLKNAAYPKATFDHETGEQNRLGGETTGGFQNSGQMFEVDFGNVKITYRPWDPQYGVYSAQQGLLKFEKSDWDGNDASAPASLNEILDVLRQMGLDLDAADDTSLETFYWSHMAGVLNDRKDGNNAKWGKVNKHLSEKLNDHLSPTERLEVLRDAWAKAIGQDRVQQVVESGWWKPRLSHASLHAVDAEDIEDGQVRADAEGSGRPYWFRPDLTMEELYAKVGNESPSSNLTYGGKWDDAALIATSGGSLSSEERARYYGHQAKAGASSGSDAEKGSSGFVFMRSTSTNHHDGGQVYYHPRVYLRTTNYGFNTDNYGNTSLRKEQSTWDPAHAFSHSTEYMTKGSISVLSDYAILTFQTEQQRQDAIKAYKARGITMINGIPIEEMFHTGTVSPSTYQSIIKRLWETAIEEEKEAFA